MTKNIIRQAYSWRRDPKVFKNCNITPGQFYNDTPKTKREDLNELRKSISEENRHIIYVIMEKDFGVGKKAKLVRKDLEKRGAEIVIVGGDDPEKKPVGRAPKYDPPADIAKYIGDLWYDEPYGSQEGIADIAARKLGLDVEHVTRQQLDRYYGPRNGSKREEKETARKAKAKKEKVKK